MVGSTGRMPRWSGSALPARCRNPKHSNSIQRVTLRLHVTVPRQRRTVYPRTLIVVCSELHPHCGSHMAAFAKRIA